MILGFLNLLLCQLAGEVLVFGLGLPIPGPVIGMVIICCLFMVHPKIYERTKVTAHLLLRNLALFFVPAGVGFMMLSQTLHREGFVLVFVIVISTLATGLVAGYASEKLIRK